MRALVIGTPKFQIPPEQLPSTVDGAIAWHERYQDKFQAFGTFPGGGGFGVVEVADEAELNQLIIEMPFSWFSEVEVRTFVDGAAGLHQLKQAVDAMAAMA
jgi:hypothetical protein